MSRAVAYLEKDGATHEFVETTARKPCSNIGQGTPSTAGSGLAMWRGVGGDIDRSEGAAGLLGRVEGGGPFVGHWSDATGEKHREEFPTRASAIREVSRRQAGGMRFHDLRRSYATWLVDDGVPVSSSGVGSAVPCDLACAFVRFRVSWCRSAAGRPLRTCSGN